jgi:spore photoproduct lyase
VTKFTAVEPLLGLPHHGRTRCRLSLNALPVARQFEAGVPGVPERLLALRALAQDGYPVGVVLAPIMPIADWEQHYAQLLDDVALTLDFHCDLTFELITHRFTPGSRTTLLEWYPATKLDLDPANRQEKRSKFGGVKYVHLKDVMKALRGFFETEIARRLLRARILYFT